MTGHDTACFPNIFIYGRDVACPETPSGDLLLLLSNLGVYLYLTRKTILELLAISGHGHRTNNVLLRRPDVVLVLLFQ